MAVPRCSNGSWKAGRVGSHPVQQGVQLGLGLGQEHAALGGQAAQECDLVVVDVVGTARGVQPAVHSAHQPVEWVMVGANGRQ